MAIFLGLAEILSGQGSGSMLLKRSGVTVSHMVGHRPQMYSCPWKMNNRWINSEKECILWPLQPAPNVSQLSVLILHWVSRNSHPSQIENCFVWTVNHQETARWIWTWLSRHWPYVQGPTLGCVSAELDGIGCQGSSKPHLLGSCKWKQQYLCNKCIYIYLIIFAQQSIHVSYQTKSKHQKVLKILLMVQETKWYPSSSRSFSTTSHECQVHPKKHNQPTVRMPCSHLHRAN